MATTRPFAYNPTSATITGTINIGTLCIGVSDLDYSSNPGGLTWWMGPDEDTGYVIAKDVSSSDFPTPLGNIGNVQFWRTSSISNSEFIELAQILTSQIFLDSDSAKTYLNSNGYWTSFELNLLLDLYPNAAVAYSLRKLSTAYSGSAIQVRREVDNTTQDIGFNSTNNLDTATLNSFIGNNLMLQSEDFNTTWTKTNSVVITGAIAAPVGVGLADKLNENATNVSHTLTQSSGTLTLGGTYFFSIYLRAAERNIVEFVSGIATGSTQIARVNLTTGTIVSNTFSNTPTLTSVGGGWYKFELLVTSGVTSNSTGFQIRLTNGTLAIYAGTTGFGCYIWGAQMSGYTDSTVPYFKTTTVRAADAFVTIWYDQSGNGRNAEQTTPSNQARIVSNGLVIIDAVTLKPTTTWTADRYTIIGGVSPITRYLSIGVLNRTANSNVIAHIGVANAISGVNGQQTFLWQPTTGTIRTDMFSVFNHGTNISTGAFITTSEKKASNLKTVYLNGTALALAATEAPSTAGTFMNTFGQNATNFTTCQYQEYIYWNSEQSANRIAIETLINNYYAIY